MYYSAIWRQANNEYNSLWANVSFGEYMNELWQSFYYLFNMSSDSDFGKFTSFIHASDLEYLAIKIFNDSIFVQRYT